MTGLPAAFTTWTHKKRGTRYEVQGTGRITGDHAMVDDQPILLTGSGQDGWLIATQGDGTPAHLQTETPLQPGRKDIVIYKDVEAQSWWARPAGEFLDGRFLEEQEGCAK